MAETLFPCALVGSYAQPGWLIDHASLKSRFPPRVRVQELWRVAFDRLEEAQDDATILAIRDQEKAGLDIIGDGEMRRESYSNHLSNALEGVDIDNPGTALDRSGEPVSVPRVVGPIRRNGAIGERDVKFLRAQTDRPVKYTVPGPFTMSQQVQNDYYASDADCAMAYADAVNGEVKDLLAAGADRVQLDEPYMQARPEKAREYGLEGLNRALGDVAGKTGVHICFGYAALIHERPEAYSFLPELHNAACDQVSIETAQSQLDCSVLESLPEKEILLGVLDLSTSEVDPVSVIKDRVKRALDYCDAERITLGPDCGMKYLSRETAFGKLTNMVQAARELREEVTGG